MGHPGYRAYRDVDVQSSDPKMLLLMVFDHAVKCLQEAIRAIETKDWEKKRFNIARAQQVLDYLQATLDDSAAPDLAQNLRALYSHINTQLVEADLQDDIERLRYAHDIMDRLRGAWREAAARCQ